MGELVVGRSAQAAAGVMGKHLKFPLDIQYRISGRPQNLAPKDEKYHAAAG
jgi:hypothetical protein